MSFLPSIVAKKRNILIVTAIILFIVVVVLRLTGILTAITAGQLKSSKIINKIKTASGQWHVPEKTAYFNSKELDIPQVAPHLAQKSPNVLSAVPGQEKWIEIDLSEQRLRAWEGERLVYDFIISTGTRWTPTPTGEYRIWIKLRYQDMEGGSQAWGNYYYLPNVPFIMYFYKGYGIHGTYWHDNFGTPMSHGCVNLRTPDAEKLFWWAHPVYRAGSWATRPTDQDLGTRVVVHE